MRTMIDFSPFYRSAIGFDRIFDMLNGLDRLEPENYPPYNIEKVDEDSYRLCMAVAGFTADDLTITAQPNLLVVEGQREPGGEAEILHRGLGLRPFRRRFNLADHIEVREAHLENGLLTIELVRNIPEALRPHRIPIGNAAAVGAIEHKAGDEAVERRAA